MGRQLRRGTSGRSEHERNEFKSALTEEIGTETTNEKVQLPDTRTEDQEKPSLVLEDILKLLDLRFERDVGMLTGLGSRNVPPEETLQKLQAQLGHLHELLEGVASRDRNTIEQIRRAYQNRGSTNELTDPESEKVHEEDERHTESTQASEIKESTETSRDATFEQNVSPRHESTINLAANTGNPVEAGNAIIRECSPSLDHNLKTESVSDTEKKNFELDSSAKSDGEEVIPPTESRKADGKPVIDAGSIKETGLNPEGELNADEHAKPSTTELEEERIGASLPTSEGQEINTEEDTSIEPHVKKELASEALEEQQNSPALIHKESVSENFSDEEKEVAPDDTLSSNIPLKRAIEEQESSRQYEAGKKLDRQPSKKLKTDSQSSDKHVANRRSSEKDLREAMENDPSVKNPKSEFVISQTLPAAAAALGLFNEAGLESTGEDLLKEKYKVASYPTKDLSEFLPGVLPDSDFSNPKPTNQIQYSTFLTSVDGFFKPLTEDDIKFLKKTDILPPILEMDKSYDPEITPFIIPKLGPLYTETWAKEDSNSQPAVDYRTYNANLIAPKGSSAEMNETKLDSNDISCGPLLSRLLSAIMKENHTPNSDKADGSCSDNKDIEIKTEEELPIPNKFEEDNNNLETGTTSSLSNLPSWTMNGVNIDYPTFEERLKRELKYVGIYMNMPKNVNNVNGDDPDWLTGREDDEVSAELRQLQATLKAVSQRNKKRKSQLVGIVERRLAWQEYYSILDDLDKQLDQAYVKRFRVPKKKKKHGTNMSSIGGTSQLAQQKAANSSLKALIDKRNKWISKIGPLFDEPEIMKRIPKESVFKDIDQEAEEEEDADVFGQNISNKDEELTEN